MPTLREAQIRHASHYRDVAEEADQLYLKGYNNVLWGLELFDCERLHIEAAFEWLAPRRDKASAALLVSLVSAVSNTGQSLRFHPQQLIRWLEGQRVAAVTTKDRQAEGVALGNLGVVFLRLDEPRKAIEFYEQALAIDREIGDRRSEGTSLGNIGNAYFLLGEPGKAVNFHEEGIAIARETGDRSGEVRTLFNSALALDKLGKCIQAIAQAEAALNICEGIGHPLATKVRAKLEKWRRQSAP